MKESNLSSYALSSRNWLSSRFVCARNFNGQHGLLMNWKADAPIDSCFSSFESNHCVRLFDRAAVFPLNQHLNLGNLYEKSNNLHCLLIKIGKITKIWYFIFLIIMMVIWIIRCFRSFLMHLLSTYRVGSTMCRAPNELPFIFGFKNLEDAIDSWIYFDRVFIMSELLYPG